MAASDAGAWARLRLVQGASGKAHWEFGGGASETRLTVGSNPSCQWVIEDPSVEPFHLVLRWDGASLSVAGSRESVALTLDGKPVGTSFERVAGRARVEFGRCALVAETSVGEVRRNRATVSSVPPAPASRFASSQSPRAQPSSARPPVRTIMGVAPLTDSSPPTRSPAPGPSTGRGQPAQGATASGSPPVAEQGEESGPWSRPERSPARAAMPGSDRSMSSTRYGMGSPLNVDVVSPEGLKRSSVPPSGDPDAGRPTEPGYRDSHPPRGGARAGRHAPLGGARSDPTPTDTRLVEDAVKVRAVAPVQPTSEPAGARAPTEPSETPGDARRPALHPGAAEGSEPAGPRSVESAWDSDPEASAGSSQFAPDPPLVRHSGPPPARKPSTFAIVLGLVALAGLGAWVYALSSL